MAVRLMIVMNNSLVDISLRIPGEAIEPLTNSLQLIQKMMQLEKLHTLQGTCQHDRSDSLHWHSTIVVLKQLRYVSNPYFKWDSRSAYMPHFQRPPRDKLLQ